MRAILLLVLCAVGCTSANNPFIPGGPYVPSTTKGMAKVAVISATIDLDKPRFNEKTQPPKLQALPDEYAEAPVGPLSDPDYEPEPAAVPPWPEPDPLPPVTEEDLPAVVDDGKTVVHVFAPQWDEACGPILAELAAITPAMCETLTFKLILERPPEALEGPFPLLVWQDPAGTYTLSEWPGLQGFAQIVAAPQQYRVGPAAPVSAPAPVEGKKKPPKRAHGYETTPGTISIPDLLPYIIGDSLTFVRKHETALSLAVGYGVKLIIPAEMQITARKTSDVIEVTVDTGAPELHLPLFRKLYPIRIEGAKLEGKRLTIILDGWKDYTIDMNW